LFAICFRFWQKELEKSKHKKKKPSLLRAIIKAFGLRMIAFGMLMFIGDTFLR
jgi:hypothetical protein